MGNQPLSLILSNDFEDPILYLEARSVISSDQNEKLKLSVTDSEKLDADRQEGASKEQASQSVVLKELFRVKPALPIKPCTATSTIVGEAYTAAGQAGVSLHTMVVLQTCSRMAKKVLTLMGPLLREVCAHQNIMCPTFLSVLGRCFHLPRHYREGLRVYYAQRRTLLCSKRTGGCIQFKI